MSSSERLYTPELLALTLRLAEFPWDEALPLTGDARSRSCGSTLSLGLGTDNAGGIARIGMRVHACAVGQATAALFADAARGRDEAAIRRALEEVTAWLAGDAPLPDWPGIEAIEPARAYPARHGAILLPWQAAAAALSSAPPSG